MSTQLVKLTEERIGNNNQLQKFVQQARAVANVIFPETLPFSDKYCRLGAEIVTVNPNDDKQVYQNESGGFCLHLSKLNEIAKAAKIRVVGSRILERKVDETGRVTFISHEVTVQYRTVSGEMIKESYTGKYDYFNDAATKSEKQTKSRRKHAEALAESNALTRAFNKVLPQLPQSFNKKDFDKPFLIPYVEEDKDAALRDLSPEDQNYVKKQRALKALGIADTIYQSGTPGSSKQVEEAVVTEEITEVPQNETPPNETPEVIAETYREAPQKERTEKILQLIELKKFKDPITVSRIEANSLDNQIKFLKKLLEMPDAEEELPE